MILSITSLLLIVFCVIVIVLGIVKLHEYPGLVAKRRNHPQRQAIIVCSLLGLLVFPLWMFALVWAYGGTIGTPLPQDLGEAPDGTAPEPAAGAGGGSAGSSSAGAANDPTPRAGPAPEASSGGDAETAGSGLTVPATAGGDAPSGPAGGRRRTRT